MFKDMIQNDEFVVFVAEDVYRYDEKDSSEAIIPPNNGWEPPRTNTETVVVGVASIRLGKSRAFRDSIKDESNGQYPSLDVEFTCAHALDSESSNDYPVLLGNSRRDLNNEHYDGWGHKLSEARKR